MKVLLTDAVVKKLVLARYLYALAEDNVRPEDPMTAYAGVNLLQDSVEAYLLALGEMVSANIDPNTKFDKYFELIEEKLPPGMNLPGKVRLLSLNKVRVNSKHYAVQPDMSEAISYLTTVRDFFEDTSSTLLNRPWSSITLLDLIRDGEAKMCLRAAQEHYAEGRHSECLTECRKAIFVEFESNFNIFGAIPDDAGNTSLWAMLCSAPQYARARSYVETHVKNPTDYIVYDYDRLHRTLDENGVRVNDYWNVWRLTPEVFRSPGGSWAVKREFRKLSPDSAQNSEYVLQATVRIILAKQRALSSMRTPHGGAYCVVLKRERTTVYAKADVSSEVVWTTPEGLLRLNSGFLVEGLDSFANRYYQVWPVARGALTGYILESDVDRLEEGMLGREDYDLIQKHEAQQVGDEAS